MFQWIFLPDDDLREHDWRHLWSPEDHVRIIAAMKLNNLTVAPLEQLTTAEQPPNYRLTGWVFDTDATNLTLNINTQQYPGHVAKV